MLALHGDTRLASCHARPPALLDRRTHKTPNDNTNATVIFFCVVICTDHIIGIGMIAYIQSVMTVITDIEYAAFTKSVPGAQWKSMIVKSHCAATLNC